MAGLLGLVVLVLVVTAEAYVGNSSESDFCKETKECLLYDLVCKTADYEVRHYSPTKLVSTDEKSLIMDIAVTTAFMRLFKYITGTNENGVKIDMTAPVIVTVQEKMKMFSSSVYTVSFVLPLAYQESPPTPTDPELYFTDMPDMNVYVRSYGGWMQSLMVDYHSRRLKNDLDRVQASYREFSHYALGYDSPMKIFNRHNEIWYAVKGQPVCTAPKE